MAEVGPFFKKKRLHTCCAGQTWAIFLFLGSGCGTVGRAVAHDTRGPAFECSQWQLLLNYYLQFTVCRTEENKEKRDGMAHLKKNFFPGCVDHQERRGADLSHLVLRSSRRQDRIRHYHCVSLGLECQDHLEQIDNLVSCIWHC